LAKHIREWIQDSVFLFGDEVRWLDSAENRDQLGDMFTPEMIGSVVSYAARLEHRRLVKTGEHKTRIWLPRQQNVGGAPGVSVPGLGR
jgi:hypothetical protein